MMRTTDSICPLIMLDCKGDVKIWMLVTAEDVSLTARLKCYGRITISSYFLAVDFGEERRA